MKSQGRAEEIQEMTKRGKGGGERRRSGLLRGLYQRSGRANQDLQPSLHVSDGKSR